MHGILTLILHGSYTVSQMKLATGLLRIVAIDRRSTVSNTVNVCIRTYSYITIAMYIVCILEF